MSWVAAAIGGSALLGYFGSQKAAGAQSDASQAGIAEQRRQFDLNRSDLAPYRSAGQSALQALLTRLGLNGGSSGGPASSPGRGVTFGTAGAIPGAGTQLASSPGAFTAMPNIGGTLSMTGPQGFGAGAIPQGAGTQLGSAPTRDQFMTGGGGYVNAGTGPNGNTIWQQAQPTFDQAGFDKATAAFNAQQQGGGGGVDPSTDPNFGSLLKPFTGADLQNEPGYQFGLTEGERAINNLSASRGTYFSGGTGKALTQYGQDYAGTKYNDAYNRDAADKTRTANLLSGVAGTGQSATNTGVNSGNNSTNAISNLMTQGGNAAASGYVGGVNAINSGVSNGINWNMQNRTLDLLRSPTYSPTGNNTDAYTNMARAY